MTRLISEYQLLQLSQIISTRSLITYHHSSNQKPQKMTNTYTGTNKAKINKRKEFIGELGKGVTYVDVDLEHQKLVLSNGVEYESDIFYRYLAYILTPEYPEYVPFGTDHHLNGVVYTDSGNVNRGCVRITKITNKKLVLGMFRMMHVVAPLSKHLKRWYESGPNCVQTGIPISGLDDIVPDDPEEEEPSPERQHFNKIKEEIVTYLDTVFERVNPHKPIFQHYKGPLVYRHCVRYTNGPIDLDSLIFRCFEEVVNSNNRPLKRQLCYHQRMVAFCKNVRQSTLTKVATSGYDRNDLDIIGQIDRLLIEEFDLDNGVVEAMTMRLTEIRNDLVDVTRQQSNLVQIFE